MRFLKQLSFTALAMAIAMPAMAGNILEDETDNNDSAGLTIKTLDNGDFGIDDGGAAGADYWRQLGVSLGDLIYAATVDLGAEDTTLTIYNNDGTTQTDETIPNPKLGTNADDGQGTAAAIAGLQAQAPGKLFFHVEDTVTPDKYQLCTVVADSSDVGSEAETVNNKNDQSANATPYTNTVMSGSYDEVDYYSFTAVVGSRVMVILNNDPDRNKAGAALETPLIEIVGADDMPLAVYDDGAQTIAAATSAYLIPQTGTYFVRIKEDDGVLPHATGDYDFVICGATAAVNDGPAGTVGDFVWFDRNDDGVQDTGEPGIKGMTVNLLDDFMQTYRTTRTKKNGEYSFKAVPNGTYFVELVPPLGAEIAMQDQGGDDKIDSDAAPITGITAPVVVDGGTGSLNTDIGLRPKGVTPCGAFAVGNDSAEKVSFKHQKNKLVKVKGTKATINPADIAGTTWLKLCVYYDGVLAVESYVGAGDTSLEFRNGALKYRSRNTNVTGLQAVSIKPGTGTAKYLVKMKGVGVSPPAAVTTVDFNLETSAGLVISEQLIAAQLKQKGNKLKGRVK